MSDSNSSSELHVLSVIGAAAAIRDGSLSAVDYVGALLRRCREKARLKAFITLDEEAILEMARASDLHRKSKKSIGLLHGGPIAIKDSINTKDMPTSVGTKLLAGFRPEQDARVVARMKAAGAIQFGKSNLVEVSYGLTGANAHYGQAKNPYDEKRITGGSSNGAGASVAARLVPAALGGDTVGSIRVPASLHSPAIFSRLLTGLNETEPEFRFGRAYRAEKYRKSGAPDTIRTCDLCLRRAKRPRAQSRTNAFNRSQVWGVASPPATTPQRASLLRATLPCETALWLSHDVDRRQ